ncbi:uncharacterized protein DSM5745_08538 [Aspergillus mulundensis]|uniref:Protein kinase domain-containing protein n=1 Tax=Aspergillus mulundensis TaxID=1810919 RepID=A0A3D8R489_9EURO|nr:hypothetical protein DSM5745_08538 [Aspergillus mulundensis]RDW68778.1 hypothetical protein DSM5745_08538 [Aspergillus mulundensis]
MLSQHSPAVIKLVSPPFQAPTLSSSSIFPPPRFLTTLALSFLLPAYTIVHFSFEATIERAQTRIRAFPRPNLSLLAPNTVAAATDTLPVSRRSLRPISTTLRTQVGSRYHAVGMGGTSTSAEIFKAVDVDNARFLAVRIAARRNNGFSRHALEVAAAMVDTLCELNHDHIVSVVGLDHVQGPSGAEVRLLSELGQTNVQLLVQQMSVDDVRKRVALPLLRDMLQALDYLAAKSIVHRDVTPPSIECLCHPTTGELTFRLSDFRMHVSCELYRMQLFSAPEYFRGASASTASDVWSLFVTLLWAINADNIRSLGDDGVIVFIQTVLQISRASQWAGAFREMRREDPTERASAAQMLVKLFGGQGVSTPLGVIPPLASTS